jgi:hypothetical protein
MSNLKARDLEPGDVLYLPFYAEVISVTATADGGQRLKIKIADQGQGEFTNSGGWVFDPEKRPELKFTDERAVEILSPPGRTLYVDGEDDRV